MAAEIYRNRQRTSARSGILKADAAARFARVLADFNVDHFQDVDKILGLPAFEAVIKEIPGSTAVFPCVISICWQGMSDSLLLPMTA
jgi:hypothetical protein